MKKKLPILTRAESQLMQLLWLHGPCTIHELVEAQGHKFAYTTVLTLVRILEQKGYVSHERHPDGGKAHVYRAAVERAKARTRHVLDLVERLFGGRTQDLVVGLIDDQKLDRVELESLRKRIDEQLGGQRRRS